MADVPAPLGESPEFLAHLDHISRIAPVDRPVLVIGESGVGKHWLAVRYDGIAAELPPNFTATCMLMLPVYGDALSVPPHESRSR